MLENITKMKSKALLTMICLAITANFTISCSTHGLHDEYFGATEQRLLTHSIDQLISMLPEKDFMPYAGQTIYIECHFIKDNLPLKYAAKRIKMEFIQKYSCTIADSADRADVVYDFFFTALGTDSDSTGFKTPEFFIPGMTGTVTIDLISLDMYHGVSEVYYYITDSRAETVAKKERIRSIIRTDKLALPIISIPINTLD